MGALMRRRAVWYFVKRDAQGREIQAVPLPGNPDTNGAADKAERQLWCGVNHGAGETWDVEKRKEKPSV